jgi:hypothetical protein
VPDRASVSDLGNGLQYAEYVDLNYLKERDDAAYRHFADGKPDVFTHALAVDIKVPANARYIPPSAQGGVGLVLQKTEADTYQVAAMVRDGPAHRSRRISKGDTLVQVNGQTFENHRARLDGPLSQLSGPAGSDVKLRFQKGNGEVRDVTLSRDAACFPDEIAFSVTHFGQKYQPTLEAAFDNSRHSVSGYVPPPVNTTAPPHAQFVRTSLPRPRTTGVDACARTRIRVRSFCLPPSARARSSSGAQKLCKWLTFLTVIRRVRSRIWHGSECGWALSSQ